MSVFWVALLPARFFILLDSVSTSNMDAELFAIDNILNQDDYQAAISHTGNGGLRIGIILRTEPLLQMAIEE